MIGGDHRHADSRDHAGGADRAGADADLDRVDPEIDQRLCRFTGGDVAGDDVHIRKLAADPADHVEHALRVAVSRIDHEDVDVGGDQRLSPLQVSRANADAGAAPQASERVLARDRILDRLLNVLDRDQPLQHEPVVHHQELFDLVTVQESRALRRAWCQRER